MCLCDRMDEWIMDLVRQGCLYIEFRKLRRGNKLGNIN